MVKRLYRSRTEEMIGGVCGGLANHFDVDPVLVRLIAAVTFFASAGFAFIAYLVAMIIIPKEPFGAENEAATPEKPEKPITHKLIWHGYIPGLVLVCLGGMLLLRNYYYWIDFAEVWPVLLIVGGLGLIIFHSARSPKDALNEKAPENLNASNGGNNQ